jgi:uncharacterized protein (UPF0210 family)
MKNYTSLFRIRTVTCFVTLSLESYKESDDGTIVWQDPQLEQAAILLRRMEASLTEAGYTVQTVRLAFNAFGDWIPVQNMDQTVKILVALDQWLKEKKIDFCSLGSAANVYEVSMICPLIVQTSPRFSCSANLTATDVEMAHACGAAIRQIAYTTEPASFMQEGLGNFRFAVSACCPPGIPFFPVARAPSKSSRQHQGISFAIGLENGALAQHLLTECKSLANIHTVFKEGLASAVQPVEKIALAHEVPNQISYAGTDTSLNPSLDENGSVAAAFETLTEVKTWLGPGTLAVAAAITKSLQSLNCRRTGYCGIVRINYM